MLNNRIFDSVKDIENELGVKVILTDSDCVPEGCNILCFSFENNSFKFCNFFMETTGKLYLKGSREDRFPVKFNTLEDYSKNDIKESETIYIYLRLESPKEKFTPERLLGVETPKGYVVEVYKHEYTQLGFSLRLSNDKVIIHNPLMIRYYISDDSDETVSFDEYIDMFYTR